MARVFVYENREYPDPDPNMSIDDVRASLASFFPELANASANTVKREEDDVTTFSKRVGTKGADADSEEGCAMEIGVSEAYRKLPKATNMGTIEFRVEGFAPGIFVALLEKATQWLKTHPRSTLVNLVLDQAEIGETALLLFTYETETLEAGK